MDNGSKKRDGKTPEDHPSLLALIVGRDGKVFSLLSNGQQYNAGSLAKWAVDQANKYEKAHPSTRIPFVRAKVEVHGEGTDLKAECEEIEKARAANKPVMLYFGRGHFDPKDKAAKKESKLARKVEKGTLNSKTALKQIGGWVLLRFDISDEEHAAFAAAHGVEAAPAFLMWLPGEEQPQPVDRKISGHGLASLFKKHKSQ